MQVPTSHNDPARYRYRHRHVAVLIAAAVVAFANLLVFWPVIHAEFLNWDDDRNFLQNPAFALPLGDYIHWASSTFHLGVWQPLAWWLFKLEFAIEGMSPRVFHAFGLGWHVANSIAFFFLARSLLRAAACAHSKVKKGQTAPPSQQVDRRSGPIIAPAAAALLFAIHPLRVEATAWASCQPYLPCAFFSMMSVVQYLRAADDAPRPALRWARLALCFVLFLCAVAFKAPAVVLPLLLLVVDVYPLRRVHLFGEFNVRCWLRVLAEKIPFLLVALAIAVLALHAKDFNESRVPFAEWNASHRLAQSADSAAFHLRKTLIPTDLSPYYALPPNLDISKWPHNALAAGVLILTFALAAVAPRFPALIAAWGTYLLLLAPNLGLIQISQQLTADRYGYMATMPFFVLFAGAVARLLQRGSEPGIIARSANSPDQSRWRHAAPSSGRIAVVCSIVAGVLILFAVRTRSTLRTWHDSESLWRASLVVNPACEHSHCQLGDALTRRAQQAPPAARGAMLDDAIRHFRESIRLRPDFAFAYNNLGAALLAAGRFAEAETAYLGALKHESFFSNDERARVHAGLALVYANLRDMAAARAHIRQAQMLGLPPEQVLRLMDAL